MLILFRGEFGIGMANQPLVSIVIPVYNGSNFLAEAVDSALGQTYPNVEVLVINDGSNDAGATKRVALGYGSKVRYIEKENGGVSSALNRGLREMNGEYFSWLSHDDIFREDKIESQIKFASETGAKFIYSSYSFLYETDKSVVDFNIDTTPDKNIFLQMVLGFPIHGCTTLLHKDVIAEVGFFDESLKSVQDYDYWLRCAKSMELYSFEKNVLYGRVHGLQGSVAGLSSGFHYEVEEVMVKMARYIMTNRIFTQKEVFQCIFSLSHRKFYSSSQMFIYGLRSYFLRSLFSFYLALHQVFVNYLFFEGFYKRIKRLIKH